MPPKPRILIVEDEPGIVDFLEMGLRHEGFDVRSEPDGESGLRAFEEATPSLVILDVMLPSIDGMELCRRIRARSGVPVIMLTAKGDVESSVDGFAAGADDYVPKPFRFEELLARVRAVLRRAGEPDGADELSFGDLTLSLSSREVQRGNRPLALTAREFELLTFSCASHARYLAKTPSSTAYGAPTSTAMRTSSRSTCATLRRKLGDPPLIHTLRGAGYVLRDAAPANEAHG